MYDVKTGKVLYLEGKYSEALDNFYSGAEEGCAEAAFNYAYMHLRGVGVEVDYSVARSFFIFASAEIGEACYNLSVMYLHGLGVARDYAKSFEYMNDAARAGVIEAQLYLGAAHVIGYMYEPDITSISLIPFHTPEYRDPFSEIEGFVPDMSEDEEKRIRTVRMDHLTSFEWFERAAKHNPDYVEELSQKGKYLYARCFIDGVGVDFNRDRGCALMLEAAASGSKEAYGYLVTEAPYVLADPKNRRLVEIIEKQKYLN